MENKRGFGFSVNEVQEVESNFEPMPKGCYSAMITGAEFKAPKKGGADYLQIEYTLIDNDRKVWDILSIDSTNDTAKNIARSRLKAICKACNLDLVGVSNPEQLLHRSLKITLGIKKDAEYGDKNIVKKVEPSFSEEVKSTNEAVKGDDVPW